MHLPNTRHALPAGLRTRSDVAGFAGYLDYPMALSIAYALLDRLTCCKLKTHELMRIAVFYEWYLLDKCITLRVITHSKGADD